MCVFVVMHAERDFLESSCIFSDRSHSGTTFNFPLRKIVLGCDFCPICKQSISWIGFRWLSAFSFIFVIFQITLEVLSISPSCLSLLLLDAILLLSLITFCSLLDFGFSLAESKSTIDTSRDQPTLRVVSSTTTSNAESNSSTSKLEEELKVASRLRKFAFNDLKLATRNFRPESLLGEGGFGCVFKGWIEENGTAPVKPGTGLTVAVKTLNHDGLQGHKEWLVCILVI